LTIDAMLNHQSSIALVYQSFLKALNGLVHRRGLQKNFRARTPDHYGAAQIVLFLKILDVVLELFRQIHFVDALF
jgi:hypothetical protein